MRLRVRGDSFGRWDGKTFLFCRSTALLVSFLMALFVSFPLIEKMGFEKIATECFYRLRLAPVQVSDELV
jgi:hypothetical protein